MYEKSVRNDSVGSEAKKAGIVFMLPATADFERLAKDGSYGSRWAEKKTASY